VSDGSEPSARFTFYPRAAGWSSMHPDDSETAANLTQFVEATLRADGGNSEDGSSTGGGGGSGGGGGGRSGGG
jgi:hypothetical protein